MRPRICLARDAVRIVAVLAPITMSFPAQGAVIFTGDGMMARAAYTTNNGTYDVRESRLPGSNLAVTGGAATINYMRFDTLGYTSVLGTQQATAQTTPGQPTLMRIHTSFRSNTPDPGPIVGAVFPATSVSAEASWNSVEARVSGRDGQPLPGSIRLEFQLDYQSPSAVDRYGLGGKSWYNSGYMAQELHTSTGPVELAEAGSPMEGGESPVQAQPDGSLRGTFHYDLGLSAAGVSDLFSMKLSSYLSVPEILHNRASSLDETMSLSLTGVYLPDGTSLSDAGYDLTLESGVYRPSDPVPAPVPEPAAAIVWCLMAGFGATIIRRGRAGRRDGPRHPELH